MNVDNQNHGIVPSQLNLDLLKEIFPVLNYVKGEPIKVTKNDFKCPKNPCTLVIASADVTELKLPVGKDVEDGLEYHILNASQGRPRITYDGLSNETHILQNGEPVRATLINGKYIFEYFRNDVTITSENQEFVPRTSMLVKFEPGNGDLIYDKLVDIQNVPISMLHKTLTLVNRSSKYSVVVRYRNRNKIRSLWLPPLSNTNIDKPIYGTLEWTGNHFINTTKDEYIATFTGNTVLPEDDIFGPPVKDVAESTLHIIPCGGAGRLLAVGIGGSTNGTRVNCVLEDPSPEMIQNNSNIVHVNDVMGVEVRGEFNYRFPNRSNVALSSVLPSVEIEFQKVHGAIWEFTPIKSSSLGRFVSKSIGETRYAIGVRNHLHILFQTSIASEHACPIVFKRNTNDLAMTCPNSEIPENTSIRIEFDKTSDRHSVAIFQSIVLKYDSTSIDFDQIIGRVNLGRPIDNVVFHNCQFIKPTHPSLVGPRYIPSHPGERLLNTHVDWFTYTEYTKNMVWIPKGTGLTLMSEWNPNFSHQYVVRGDIARINRPNTAASNKLTIGRDYYVYAYLNCSWEDPLHGVIENRPEVKFIATIIPPWDMKGAIEQRTPGPKRSVAAYCLIGGFHYGLIRKTTRDFIPINKDGNRPPSRNNYDWCDYSKIGNEASWMTNVTIGIVPNSTWDIYNRPRCYQFQNKDGICGGMVQVGQIWVSIYKFAWGDGSTSIRRICDDDYASPVVDMGYNHSLSLCNRHPLTGNAPYQFMSIGARLGMRLPTIDEWLTFAEWSPGGTADKAYVGNTNLREFKNGVEIDGSSHDGDVKLGDGRYAISAFNVCNGVSVIGELTSSIQIVGSNASQSWEWIGEGLKTPWHGKDYLPWKHKGFAVCGRIPFHDLSILSGSRTIHTNQSVWDQSDSVNSSTGVRFVSDSL